MYSKDYFNVGRLKVELVNDQNQPLRKDMSNSNIDIYCRKATHDQSGIKIAITPKEKVTNSNTSTFPNDT
jgi:hypothetical protein